jgi:hypothetical protein
MLIGVRLGVSGVMMDGVVFEGCDVDLLELEMKILEDPWNWRQGGGKFGSRTTDVEREYSSELLSQFSFIVIRSKDEDKLDRLC